MTTIGVGIIGMGFMGRTHARAYLAAAEGAGLPCRLVGCADPSPIQKGASGNLAAGSDDPFLACARHERLEPLLADPGVHLVSICTPTDTHIEIASRALRAGKHVLVEKPVALSAAEVMSLAALAAEHNRLCIPAMCMRFWPGWDWLADRVRDGTLGTLRSLSFTRLGSRPMWSPFYSEPSRCGGALKDLHIHDVDIIHWLLGAPKRVCSRGTIDHLTTLYDVDVGGRRGALVCATGGWVSQPGFTFRMRYTAEFEGAVADWDIARPEPLILTSGGTSATVPLTRHTGYDGQVRAVVGHLAGRPGPSLPDLASAASVLRTLDAEARSLGAGAVGGTAGEWVALP